MRGAAIRVELVRVEVLAGLAVEFQIDRIGPVDEILGRRHCDPAHSVAEHAEIADILLSILRPKGVVLGVKRAFGDHRLLLQLLPMQSVGRDEGEQPRLAGSAQRFVPHFRAGNRGLQSTNGARL